MLFGTGVKGKGVEVLSKELLLEFSSLYHLLYTPEKILLNRKGLGKAKVTKLSAVRELLNRVRLQTLFTVSDTKKLESLKEYLYLKSRKETRECFFLVTFGAGDNVLRVELVTRGSLKEVGVYFRDLVKMILDDGAASALISHNHPSQPAQPSSDDWELFQEFRKILLPLDVDLIDQWVMGIDGIFSCAANKLFTIPQAV